MNIFVSNCQIARQINRIHSGRFASLILESLAARMSIAEIVDAYPSLTEEAVRGALAELALQQEPHPA
jgi:hypothetical protein